MSTETLYILAWTGCGLIGGLISAGIWGGKRLALFDIIIGILGAVAGGWASVIAIGDNTPYLFIISVLSGIFVAALALWFFNSLLSRTR